MAAALGAIDAAAQTTDESLQSVQITATRVPTAANTVTQWLTLVDADDIRNRTPQVAGEALRGTRGAFFQQTAPGQGVTIVRGLKGSEVLHLVDGMRRNNAFFRTAPSQYIALVDPAALERVELVRGPAATLYGSDAMGGVALELTNAWTWNTNLRRGFRTPNVNDLAQIGRRSNNRIVVANPALDSESLWSIDTGVRGAGGAWSAEAALFYSRYRDRVTLVDTGVVYASGQNGCVRAAGCLEAQSRNTAHATYYGFEGGFA